MTPQPDIKRNPTAFNPTQKDLIFAPPTFFCFSASAQLTHLVLTNTQTDLSQNQKSQFYSSALPEQIFFPKNTNLLFKFQTPISK